jgi:hypothetical protein
MKILKNEKDFKETATWEETSGLFDFLQQVPREVNRFNETFGFGINHIINPPTKIDSNTDRALKTGFVLTRYNPLLPEVTYCLYSLLDRQMLHAYIGIYKGNDITPIKQLKPVKDFKQGQVILYDWMRQLVRASCEKVML